MATEKILIFDEAGNAKRMKVRIARFLDNEPVTASDKTNIRTTLDVDDSLSGTFTTPLSVTSASDSSFTGGGNVGIGTASPNTLLECYDTVKPVIRLSGSGNNAGATNYGSIEFYNRDTSGDGPNVGAQIHVQSASSSGGGGDLVFSTETVYSEGEGNAPVPRMAIDHNGGFDFRSVNGTTAAQFPSGISVNGITALPSAIGTPFIVGRDTGSLRSAHFAGHLKFDSGYGIDFGSGATLSDYEEGVHETTATPETSGTVTLQAANNTIAYTKVGRLVTLTGNIPVNSVSSPTGNFIKLSIPFAVGNYSESSGSFTAPVFVMNAANSINSYALIGIENESFLRIYKTTGTTVSSSSTAADFDGGENIYINCTYHTTA